MSTADPWAGMADPRAALKAAREAARALATTSQGGGVGGESEKQDLLEGYTVFSRSSRSSQGGRSVSPASHSAAKDRGITCSSSLSDTYANPASPDGLPDPGYDGSGGRASAEVAKRLNHESSRSNSSIIAPASSGESYAATNTVPGPAAHLQGPREWRDGLARLNLYRPPCEGFRSGEWESIHRVISHFMDHCSVEAEARGWTAIDLFGVHRSAGAAAVDSCGALMLPNGGTATSVSAEAIVFGHLVYRKRPMPQAVLVWDIAGEPA